MYGIKLIIHSPEHGISPYHTYKEAATGEPRRCVESLILCNGFPDGGEGNLLVADFTHLEYTGRNILSFTTGAKHSYLFKVLAAATGKVIWYLAPISMLEFKEDLLRISSTERGLEEYSFRTRGFPLRSA